MRSEHSWESSWGCHGPSPPCHVTHWGPASDPATEFALRFVSLTPCHGFSRSSLATPQKGGGIPRLFVQQSLRFWGSKGSASGTPDSLTCHPMDDSQPQGCCNRETLVAFSVLTTEVCNGLKLGWAFLCAFRHTRVWVSVLHNPKNTRYGDHRQIGVCPTLLPYFTYEEDWVQRREMPQSWQLWDLPLPRNNALPIPLWESLFSPRGFSSWVAQQITAVALVIFHWWMTAALP